MRRKFVRGCAGWIFGLAVSVFLISMWGRSVVSDGDTLAQAAEPLSATNQVAAIVSNWLREEMIDAGFPADAARTAADDVVGSPGLAGAMGRLTVEVTRAAASPGPGEAVVDAAAILLPAVPDLTRALSMATGSPIDESSVAAAVSSLDPIVVVAEGQSRAVGPSSTAASRLGVASVLALSTMAVVGWALVATTDEERLVELRKLLNRVALGALSFTVMLRLGSWVLSPRGGRAPVSEAMSVITASKWMVPFIVSLSAGTLALAAHETKRALRRRRSKLGETGEAVVSAADTVERAV